jgi:RimJ/RimL family protein N-acetyltransferase
MDLDLRDDLILLRPPKRSDAFVIHMAVRESLAELHPWMDWATSAYDEASTQRWLDHVLSAWENSSSFHFVITYAASGEYIGGCSVDGIHDKNRSCNLGYWVRSSSAGRGIASRAIRLAARFAFETMGLVKAEIVIATENFGSQRAAEKAGAHYVRSLPDGVVVRSDVHNGVLYQLTPADFEVNSTP